MNRAPENSGFDEESFQGMLDALRRFVDANLIPREAELDETDRIPDDVTEAMAELGIFGLSIAPQYGGLGLSVEQQMRLHMLLSEAAQRFRYAYGTNVGIGSRGISLSGTAEQKEQYLPRLASGELVSAFCATEPEAGSDLARRRGEPMGMNPPTMIVELSGRASTTSAALVVLPITVLY